MSCWRKEKMMMSSVIALRALLTIVMVVLVSNTMLFAQVRSVQIKTFDRNLKPVPDLRVSVDGTTYFITDKKGVTFVDIDQQHLPPAFIKVDHRDLEAESWNYSRGVLEIILREKVYDVERVKIVTTDNQPLSFQKFEYTVSGSVFFTTDKDGYSELPRHRNSERLEMNRFRLNGFDVTKLSHHDGHWLLTVQRQSAAVVKNQPRVFEGFDFSRLDSIRSLTVFYAVFKDVSITSLTPEQRRRLDEKFQELMTSFQDSLSRYPLSAVSGRISDSSFVKDDIRYLLQRAQQENQTLDEFRAEFNETTRAIIQKLAAGVGVLSDNDRNQLLRDINELERILGENENKFFRNKNEYGNVLAAIKASFFNLRELEDKLSASEMLRMEEQRAFRQKLIIALVTTVAFALLVISLIYTRGKLKKQQHELASANKEIQRINENLEDLVRERTRALEDAHHEMDTFLYRASHDLRSPLCSVMGLASLGEHSGSEERLILLRKSYDIASQMDGLLMKFRMISEINKPSNYSVIQLVSMFHSIRGVLNERTDQANILIDVDFAHIPLFKSYPILIESILYHLFDNATYFCSMVDSRKRMVHVSGKCVDNTLILIIRDNGVGIEESIKAHVWDMFFKGTELSKGNGLGLYIVSKSVHALGGTIEFASQPNVDTTFIVHIPVEVVEAIPEMNEGVNQIAVTVRQQENHSCTR